jgi:hypothetical protein
MPKTKSDSALVFALQEACRAAWEHWRGSNPDERFYAFALYTTPMAEFFHPLVCGELGLDRVARSYLTRFAGEPGYGSLDEVRDARWIHERNPASPPYQSRTRSGSLSRRRFMSSGQEHCTTSQQRSAPRC